MSDPLDVTDEDRRAVEDISTALKSLNAAMDRASDLGIDIEFIEHRTIGRRNVGFLIGKAVKVRNIFQI